MRGVRGIETPLTIGSLFFHGDAVRPSPVFSPFVFLKGFRMSISESVALLRAESDVTMPMAAAERVKTEVFELTRRTAMILGGHPAQAEIEGPAAQATAVADSLIEALAALSGAVVGVADTLSRG